MKKTFEPYICFGIGIIFTLVLFYIFDFNYERRFVLYHIRNELRNEMPRDEVEKILNNHQTSFIHKYETDSGITLRVDVGIAKSYSLLIGFSEGKLDKALFATEDCPCSPYDAPTNIE